MNESSLQRTVHALLRARPELLWHHCGRPDYCTGQAGLPDLLVVGCRRMVWRELKGEDTPLRRPQREFGEALMLAGGSWGVWRPGMLEAIESELDGLL